MDAALASTAASTPPRPSRPFLLDRLIPPEVIADPDSVPRARMVIAIVLCSLTGQLTFGGFALLRHDTATLGSVVVGLVVQPITVGLMWWTQRVQASGWLLTSLWTLSILGSGMSAGALQVINSGWPIFGVLLATFLLGAKAGTGVAGTLAAGLSLIAGLQRAGKLAIAAPPTWGGWEGSVLSIAVLMFLCVLIGSFQERAYRRVAVEATDAHHKAQRSEASLRSLLNSSRDLICSVDREGRLVEMNDTCRTRLTERVGREPRLGEALLSMVTAGLVGEVGERLRGALERTLGSAQRGELEESMARPSGLLVYNISIDPICLPDGAVVGATLTARDITDRRKLEARAMIADRMSTVGTLAAGMAHELNNPLSYVMTNVAFVQDELARGVPSAEVDLEAMRSALVDAAEGATRMRDVVRDLKTFSRASETESGPVAVEAAVESAIKMCWNELRHRAQLVRDYAPVSPVRGNAARLGQIVLNLLVNAIHATPEGQSQARSITVRLREREPDRVAIEVADTGSGIRPEHLAHIFDPFFTTKAVGEGTGLGLSICHNLAREMGGAIEVESAYGAGSTFRVVLVAAAPEAVAASRASLEEANPARARLLLVEDEESLARAMSRELTKRGHEVAVESRGQQALDRLKLGQRFDLVLCDLMMPEMSGLELYDQIERVAPDQMARVAFVTGGAFTAQAQGFVARVKQPVLQKPYVLGDVLALVTRVQRSGTVIAAAPAPREDV